MSNIYDDVALLQEQMSAVQTAITALQTATQVQVLTEGADLHTLAVGKYLIPNATVSATILNKPVTNNHTATVEVIAGGDAGQKTVIYQTCSKTMPGHYHCAYYSSAWGAWNEVDMTDSGWIDLPLASGITAYSEAQKPRYRKIGKTVFLSGVYKGVTSENTTIATLPSGYRPTYKVILPTFSVGQIASKISIETSGAIVLNRTTIEPVVAENWHSIACCFESD